MSARAALLWGLIVLTAAAALGLTLTRHYTRAAFIEGQALARERDALTNEWRLLQLERAAFMADGRIERAARARLGMRLPHEQPSARPLAAAGGHE